MLQLLITFIWFGTTIPEDYIIKLGEVNFPYKLLMNPFFNTTLKLDIHKSYRYRLEYLRRGGIYSDIDNTIHNYTCLMEKLANFDGEMAVSQINADGLTPLNNFIYVPSNKTSLINQILDQNPQYHKLCETSVVGCNGPTLLYKYRERITVLNLTECMSHSNDFSWWNDANFVLNENKAPPAIIQEKMVKKKFYMEKMNEYINQKEELKKKLESVEKELNQINKKIQTPVNEIANFVIDKPLLLEKFNQKLSKEKQNILIQSNRSIETLFKKFEELNQQSLVQKQQNNILQSNLMDQLLTAQENKFSYKDDILGQILRYINVFGVFLVVMLIIVIICFRKNRKGQRERKKLNDDHQKIASEE